MGDVVDRLGLLEQSVGAAAERAGPHADGRRIAAAARSDAAAVLLQDAPGELVSQRFVATAFVELALARALDRLATRELLEAFAPADHVAIELAALAHPRLTQLALPEALDTHSILLTTLGGLTSFSAWRTDVAGRVARVHEHGASTPVDAARSLAKRCLVERTPLTGSGGLQATPVRAFGGASAALIWRTAAEDPSRARLLTQQAAAALSAPLQQALTADDNLDAHRALVQAPERRLTRLALDLHDGAMQDVALVAGELRRLEDELRPALKGSREGERIRGTLERLATLVEALDADLREVATTIEGPSMLKRPFGEAIEAVVSSFRTRSQIDAVLDVSGDVESITDSQRVTLFRVVQESLANVRQHADAHSVTVTVVAEADHLEADVVDDGIGFDLESVVEQAGRNGRLGLVGMVERVRLVGGRCDISSRPGRGTSVHVWISRYEPLPERRA